MQRSCVILLKEVLGLAVFALSLYSADADNHYSFFFSRCLNYDGMAQRLKVQKQVRDTNPQSF